MKETIQRAITGIIFVVIIIGSILLNQYAFTGVFTLVIILGMLEFYKLLNSDGIHPQKVLGTVAGVSMLLINAGVHYKFFDRVYLYIVFPFFFIIFAFELFRNKPKPFTNIAFTFFSLIYIALPIALLVNITSMTVNGHDVVYSPWLLIGYFFLIWANDSGAYLLGITMGKHKLFPRVSPKKSWEGSFGGLFFTGLFAWLLSIFPYTRIFGFSDWAIIGAIVAVMGTFGDLVESLLKRSIYIKDSGTILPGHGGILDRFDSVFLSAPFVFVYLELFT